MMRMDKINVYEFHSIYKHCIKWLVLITNDFKS